MLMSLLRQQWDLMSKLEPLSPATTLRRQRAMQPSARKSDWYKRRYGGGRKRGGPPRKRNLDRYGRDSDKLLRGFKIRFQFSKGKNRHVGRINVPARRFDRLHFGEGYDDWIETVQRHVPVLQGNLDKSNLLPQSRKQINQTMRILASPVIAKHDAKLASLIAKRNRIIFNMLKELLKAFA